MALSITSLVEGLVLTINANHDQQRRDDERRPQSFLQGAGGERLGRWEPAVRGRSADAHQGDFVNRVSSTVGHTPASSSAYGQQHSGHTILL